MKNPPYINIVLEFLFRYNANIGGFFMKKIILLMFILFCISIQSLAYQYEIPVCVTFNGEYIDFEEKPKIIDGITYLPVRFFCEALSASVDWNNSTKTVTIKTQNNEIIFKTDSTTAYVNGVPAALGGSAIIIEGRTYLPMRFIVETLGGNVDWENEYYRASVTMSGVTFPDENTMLRSYQDDEIYWLAKIISSESEDEPLIGKVAVGNVVLNRVISQDYPNTIYSVIYDNKFGYQFQPVANGSINKEPVQEAYLAAKLCLEGENVVGGCKYFLNPRIAVSNWIPLNKTYHTTIGNHDFYY